MKPTRLLRPETVKTMEMVWEQYFANHFRMTVSGFYYPIRGLISEQVDSATGNAFFANAGSLNIRGMDFELARRLPTGVEGTISYSFQDASNPAHGINCYKFSQAHRPGRPQRTPHQTKVVREHGPSICQSAGNSRRKICPGVCRSQRYDVQPKPAQRMGRLGEPL